MDNCSFTSTKFSLSVLSGKITVDSFELIFFKHSYVVCSFSLASSSLVPCDLPAISAGFLGCGIGIHLYGLDKCPERKHMQGHRYNTK